jgi:hypothetical protein
MQTMSEVETRFALTEGPVPATEVVEDPGGGHTELYDIPIRPGTLDHPSHKVLRLKQMQGRTIEELGTLLSLLRDLFVDHWREIRFGPCIEGAVFELELASQPDAFSLLDGYLTVTLPPGPAHFHLCIGATRGLGKSRTPPSLARQRECARAAFVRTLSATDCTPGSWAVRLWNGAGEQMVTVFLPSPFLDDRLRRIPADFGRLALWNELRARYLGERVPQPLPASGTPCG